jgi:hypothetical protein
VGLAYRVEGRYGSFDSASHLKWREKTNNEHGAITENKS